MFLRSLAIGGLVGLLTLTSCKSKEVYPPFFAVPIGTDLQRDLAEERNLDLEEIVEKFEKQGEEVPEVYYYNKDDGDNFYNKINETLGFDKKGIDNIKTGINILSKKGYALALHGPDGNAVVFFDKAWSKKMTRVDRESVLEHEMQHLRDFEKYGEYNGVAEQTEWELRAYTMELVKAAEKKRQLSKGYGGGVMENLQKHMVILYVYILRGYSKGMETIKWVNEKLENINY